MSNVLSHPFIQKTLVGFGLLSSLVLFSTPVQSAETLQWDENTEPDLAGYIVYQGTTAGSYETPIDVGNVTSYTVSDLEPDTTYYFAVTAHDTGGNESGPSNEVSIHVAPPPDDTSPTVMLTSPTSGATLSGTVMLQAEASDDTEVAGVQFKMNGTNWGAEDTTAPYVMAWDTTTATPGAYTLTAVARDAAGNTASSVSVQVTVTETEGGSRVTAGLVALYEFTEGAGATVADTSGMGTPLDLTIADVNDVTWRPGVGALQVNAETIVSSDGPATKVHTALMASNAVTVEAWVNPANLTQNGPARIVSLSASPYLRNLTLGQGVFSSASDRLEVRLRTSSTSLNGTPAVPTAEGTLANRLQHMVYTRDASGNVKIYLDNAILTTSTVTGDFSTWDTTMPLVLANEVNGERAWLGEYHLVAIYDTALTTAQVTQNFTAGPRGTGGATNQAPTVTAGLDQAITLPTAVTLDGTVTDDGLPTPPMVSTLWSVTSGPGPVTFGAATSVDTTASFTVAGVYVLRLTADDGALTAFDEVTVHMAAPPDETPPTVALTAPTAGSTLTGTVTVRADASDNRGVVGVQFQMNGTNWGTEDATAPYSRVWDTSTATPGAHTVTAVARDAVGNASTSAPVTVHIAAPPDETPPTVALTAPTAGATLTGTVTLQAAANDDQGVAGVQFQMNGTNWGTEDTTAPYSRVWDTSTATPGAYTITAVARDAAGNTGTSAPVTVHIAAPPPPAQLPTLTSPEVGSILSGSTVKLSWSPNTTSVSEWWLYVGSKQGSKDILNTGSMASSTLSRTVSNLPTNGQLVWVRLWWKSGGGWQSEDYAYTAASVTSSTPAISSPAAQSTFADSTVTFKWTPHTTSVSEWWLYVGSKKSSKDIFNSGSMASSTLSRTVSNLPTNGQPVWVRLWWKSGGVWRSEDYSYTAASAGSSTPGLSSPEEGSILSGSTVKLSWSPNATSVSEWWLYVGSKQGSKDILNTGSMASSTLSRTVSNIPTNGQPVWVRLWWKTGGVWQSEDYAYTASTSQ